MSDPITPRKSVAEIPTIDVNLVTIQLDNDEFGFKTASKIACEAQLETEDAVKLIVKGKLLAQKPEQVTYTGTDITLTDNVFNPELVKILQGGTIIYDSVDTTKVTGYKPPTVGSGEKGQTFTLNAYSAQYDTSGEIVQYEKTSFPHCTGAPVALNSEDGVFRVPEYTIRSRPASNESPWEITYVSTLPTLASNEEEEEEEEPGTGG